MNNAAHEKKQKGRLEVICGSMFSGKTEELMRRLRRAEYAKQTVLTIKHHIDNRYNQVPTCIVSHEGKERFAFVITDTPQGIAKIVEMSDESIDAIGIDEIQFFSPHILSAITMLIEKGKRVLVAGLDLDFRGEPFGTMPALMAFADEVVKLKAICVKCGDDAHHTQRLVNGRPAQYDDPIVQVGASELYEARCRTCFEINKPITGAVQTVFAPSISSTTMHNQKFNDEAAV
jgi:thymidine kinase